MWGWGREKKIAFMITPSVVFLKGYLASLRGEPHPDSETLCGWWAVTQLFEAAQWLSRPWCQSEEIKLGGAWGRRHVPQVWHPKMGDIFSAKIRNQTKSWGRMLSQSLPVEGGLPCGWGADTRPYQHLWSVNSIQPSYWELWSFFLSIKSFRLLRQ